MSSKGVNTTLVPIKLPEKPDYQYVEKTSEFDLRTNLSKIKIHKHHRDKIITLTSTSSLN